MFQTRIAVENVRSTKNNLMKAKWNLLLCFASAASSLHHYFWGIHSSIQSIKTLLWNLWDHSGGGGCFQPRRFFASLFLLSFIHLFWGANFLSVYLCIYMLVQNTQKRPTSYTYTVDVQRKTHIYTLIHWTALSQNGENKPFVACYSTNDGHPLVAPLRFTAKFNLNPSLFWFFYSGALELLWLHGK